MARRYLTVEDVQRAEGNEILVEDDTVVTPQALEVAESAGIAIRTSSGAYTAPPPDRGPDAGYAMRENDCVIDSINDSVAIVVHGARR